MNKKNKILTTALLTVLTLSACGSIGYVSLQNNKGEFISNQLDSNIYESGISVKRAIVENSSSKYGSQKFSYTVQNDSSLNNVLYKIAYLDGTSIASDILTITHDKNNKTIQVDCNDVFTKQIILTIYLEHDENIKADVTIDFVEILTVDSSFVQAEDNPFIITDSVSSTGGSIEVDKTIKNSIFSWNNSFKNELTDLLVESFLGDDSSLVTYAYTYLPSLDDYVADTNRKSFNTYEFMSSIYFEIETDDYYEKIYLLDASEDNLISISNSTVWKNAIYHSFVVNEKKYEFNFGIEINTYYLNATSLTSSVVSMKFGGEVSSSNNSSYFINIPIDYNNCSDKTALDGGSGEVLSSGYDNMWISDYVLVESGKTINFSSEPYKVCYYSSDKSFIKQDKFATSDTMTKTYTIPSNASYIRFQYCSDNSYDVPAVSFDNRSLITIFYSN